MDPQTPTEKITATITQNGALKRLEIIIHEVNDEPVFATLEGGPFHGERFNTHDLSGLVMLLDDLRNTMKEVAHGSRNI